MPVSRTTAPIAALISAACVAVPSESSTPPPVAERAPTRKPKVDRCECCAEDASPPTVASGLLESGAQSIVLQFSEPVVGLDAVDPAQFRVSLAMAYEDEDENDVVYEDPFYAAAPDARDLAGFRSIEVLDETRARLRLSAPLPADTCPGLDEAKPEGNARIGLFLHYRDARQGVTDEAGNRMLGFGSDWARATKAATLEAAGRGQVHQLDLLVALSCEGVASPNTRPMEFATPASGECANCCDGNVLDHRAPRVSKARFVDNQTITLTFTERIAVPEGMDPAQFRISLVTRYGYAGEDATLYYYDPAMVRDDESDTARFIAANVVDGGRGLALTLAQPLDAELCEYVREMKRELLLERLATGLRVDGEMGVYLHYTPRGPGRIHDRSGNALAEIAGDWALRKGASTAYLYGTELDLASELVEIPCPKRVGR